MYIHRIWLGGDMPTRFKEFGEQWQQLNPEFEVKDWGEELLDMRWQNQMVINKMLREIARPDADKVAGYTHLADVLDYELIYKFGGWYFNTDLKPLKPLSVLNIGQLNAVLAMEDDHHAVNMAMYAPPGHPFFKKVLDILPIRYFGNPGAFMNYTTGVYLLQQALAEYHDVNKVVRLHRNVFNPLHFTDFGYGETPDIEREYPDETVAVHLWAHRTNQRGQRILET